MTFSRRALSLATAVVLALVGLTAVPAAAVTTITIDQGESIRIGIPGVDRVTPARISWGDGSVTSVRTQCSAAKARRSPAKCTAKGAHAYASAGTFTVSSTRKGRTTVIGTVIVTAAEGGGSTPTATPSPSSTAGWQQSMLDQVNAIRASAGVAPLRMCTALERAAQSYSQAMADQKFFDHTGLDGSTPGTRARASGYDWTAVGENIAYGQDTVTQVVTAWKNSPGHYANMINSLFTDVGFGKASNPGNNSSPLWTQDFGAGGTC